MVFVLTGATLAYTGCTDYSKDLDELSNRIDKLETGSIKSVEAQIESLKSTVASLETAKAVAENAIKSLQDENSLTRTNVDALKGELATLKAELAKATANGATKDEVYALVSQISSLETEIARLKDQLAKAATQDEVAKLATKIDAGEKALAELNESLAKQIAAINTSLEGKATAEEVAKLVKQITALEDELKTMVTIETYEAKVAELEALIAEAKNMIPTEDVETLKEDMASVIDFVMKADEWILNTSYTLGQILADIDLLNETVDALIEAKMQMDEAITNLNSQVESNSEVLGVVADQLKGVLADFPTALEDIEGLKTACMNFDTALVDLSGRIDAVELLIAGIQTEVNDIWNAIYEIENSGYITEVDLRRHGYITMAEIEGFATEEYVQEAIKGLASTEYIKEKLAGYATLGHLERTLDAYATKEQVKEELKGYVTTAMLASYHYVTEDGLKETLAGYVTTDALSKLGYQNEQQVKDLIDGVVAGHYTKEEVNNAVKKLQDQIDAIKTRLDLAEGRLDNAEVDIETLAARIQSIAYVPEYKAGAYSQVVTLGTVDINTYTTATFKVYPSECARLFEVAFWGDETPTYKVFKTASLIAAASCEEVEADKIVIDAVDTETGLVTVTVNGEDLNGKAIALAYEASVKGQSGVETGSFITSDFAQVRAADNVNLLTSYVLYNPEKKVEFAAASNVVKWVDFPGVWNPYAGYEPYFKLNGKYYSIAEVEKMYYLPANSLVPSFKEVKVDETNSSADYKKSLNVNKATSLAEIAVSMGGTELKTPDKAKDYTDKYIQVYPVYNKVKNQTIDFTAYTAKYTIGWNELEFVLDSDMTPVNWSYTWVSGQSSAKTAATYLDQPISYGEVAFKNNAEVKEILTPALYQTIIGLTPSLEITNTDSNTPVSTTGKSMTMVYASSVLGPVMKVTLNGKGSYGFGEDGNVTWTYKNIYTNTPDKTKYTFTFEAVYGPAPKNAKFEVIDKDKFVIPFVTGGSAQIDLEEKLTDGLYSQLDKATIAGFANKTAFVNALFTDNNQNIVASKYVHVNPTTHVETVANANGTPATYTYLNVSSGAAFVHNTNIANREGQGVRVSYNEMNSKGFNITEDFCRFENKYSTWYGAEYTFKAEARLDIPSYQLVPVREWVENRNGENWVKAQGEKIAGKWTIKNVDLEKYVAVTGPAGESALTVKFTPVTTVDHVKGYNYIPVTDAPSYAVNPVGDEYTITAGELIWGDGLGHDYTATEVKYEAQLYLTDPITHLSFAMMSEPLKLTFYTDVMVEVKDYVTVEKDRVAKEQVVANVWEGLQVFGKDLADTEVDSYIHPLAMDRKFNLAFYNETLGGKFRDAAVDKYGLNLKLPADMSGIKAYGWEGAELTATQVDALGFTYNPATGEITLAVDAAELQCDIVFDVPVQVQYDRDYEHKQAKNVNAKVIFKKQNRFN